MYRLAGKLTRRPQPFLRPGGLVLLLASPSHTASRRWTAPLSCEFRAAHTTGPCGQRLQEVLADHLQQAEAGRAPDQAALRPAHPDLAAELQAFFADRERFAQVAQPLRDGAETIGLLPAPGATAQRLPYVGDDLLEEEIGRGGMPRPGSTIPTSSPSTKLANTRGSSISP